MTAPARSVHITSELVDRFKAYDASNDLWGVFHRQLFDGDLMHAAEPAKARTAEERELVRLFNLMSYSQREKLRERASPKLVRGGGR